MAIGSSMGGAAHGPMTPLIVIATGLVALIIIITIGPSILGQVYAAQPTGLTATNPWNTSNASNNIQNGQSLWNTATGFYIIVVLIILAAMIIGYTKFFA